MWILPNPSIFPFLLLLVLPHMLILDWVGIVHNILDAQEKQIVTSLGRDWGLVTWGWGLAVCLGRMGTNVCVLTERGTGDS